MYKIFCKVLANRLKKVLLSVIDHKQSAFLGGKFLLHSVLAVNDTIDKEKRKKKKSYL